MTPTELARQRFAGKRVTVVGLAREGLSLVRFLVRIGAEVIANDRARFSDLSGALSVLEGLSVQLVLGGHPEEAFRGVEVVFVSPGVPQQLDALAWARQNGAVLSSETQLFFELCRGRIVGITGSSGKTTTTTLVGEMLRRTGLPVHVGGNIGVPLLERVDEIAPGELVVLEMSSFQLETLPCSPPVAAVLNVTPNHLDRHADMSAYVAAKANILRYQAAEDVAVLNADDPVASSLITASAPRWFSLERSVEGASLDGTRIVLRRGPTVEDVCDASTVRLRGRHNLANVLAASAIASCSTATLDAIRATIAEFQGVPHRLEIVAEQDGITFCNDSIATSPERSMASIRSFSQPIVLIAGGRDKHLPMEAWAELIRDRVRAVVLMGESADVIAKAVLTGKGQALQSIARAGTMDDAVNLARALAIPGDVVLLAPGCTSFDMFRDFEERGERFRDCVRGRGER